MAGRSMEFAWVADDLVVLVDHLDTLRDDDLDELLRSLAARSLGPTGLRVLVYNSVGGGPNAAQRARLERQMRGRPVRIAVVCSSAFTRAIIKAFRLLGFLQIAGFSLDQVEAAFQFLNLKGPETERARERLTALGGAPGRHAAGA